MDESRILLISPFYSPNIGGVETHLKYLVKYLSKDFKIEVVTYQPLTNNMRGKSIERRKNVRIRRINWFGKKLFYVLDRKFPILAFLYLAPALFVQSLITAIKRRPDVIYGNGLISDVVAVLISKMLGIICVTSTHTDYKFSRKRSSKSKLKKIAQWIFRNSDHIFAVSEGGKKDLEKIGVLKEKITATKYWMDTEEFKPIKIKKNRRFTALYVARFVPVKDVELITEVAEKTEDIDFIFIGDGPQRNMVEKVAKKSNVKYLGFVPLEKLNKYYNQADVLLWGSIEENNLVLTTIGALAAGIPVIIPSYMKREGTKRKTDKSILPKRVGFIVEPNVKEIQKVLKKLKNNKKLLKKMSENARKFAVDNLGESRGEMIKSEIIKLISKQK